MTQLPNQSLQPRAIRAGARLSVAQFLVRHENNMRIFTSLVCGVGLVCGCSSEHYLAGRGDMGQFILEHAMAYGGHPVTTNGLPSIGGDWQYIQDKFGVGILLPVSQDQRAHDFLIAL